MQRLRLIEGDLSKVAAEIAGRYGRERRYLIRILQDIQSIFGYLPRKALESIAREVNVTLSEVLTVATFYHQFRLEPPGKYVILVCMGTACHLRGNNSNYNFLKEYLGVKPGSSLSRDGLFSVEKARCFGCCGLAPVVMVVSSDGSHRRLYGRVNPSKLKALIERYRKGINVDDK